jgi:hypothetical protein
MEGKIFLWSSSKKEKRKMRIHGHKLPYGIRNKLVIIKLKLKEKVLLINLYLVLIEVAVHLA